MNLAPEFRDRLNYQNPQPNLQDVLVVIGSHSLDDSDSDDPDEDETRDPILHRRGHRNCTFYNTKTSTNYFLKKHDLKFQSLVNFTAELQTRKHFFQLLMPWRYANSLSFISIEFKITTKVVFVFIFGAQIAFPN